MFGALLYFSTKPPEKARGDNKHVPAKCTALTERAKPIKPITLCCSPGMLEWDFKRGRWKKVKVEIIRHSVAQGDILPSDILRRYVVRR